MKKMITKVLFTTAIAVSFYACGDDSSSKIVEVIDEPKTDRCYDTYGIDADYGWSENISAGSYLEKMVCDKLTLYMRDMFSFTALCGSVEYNESKNRFDIEIVTEMAYKHIWADISGCSYKFASDGDLEGWIKTDPEWNLDECFCKSEKGKTSYRNMNPEAAKESSSSVENSSSSVSSSSTKTESSSSNRIPSGSDVNSSSSQKSSSSQFVLPDAEFVKIGTQEWMTKNLDVPVKGSRCFGDAPTNCEKYGRLYTWSMAMAVDSKYDKEHLENIPLPYRGICPEGSHLPTEDEWKTLANYLEVHPEEKAYLTNQVGGFYNYKGEYIKNGYESVFWSATEYKSGVGSNSLYAWVWAFRKDLSINVDNPYKITAASVRCIKGDEKVIEQSSSSEETSSSSSEEINSSSSETVTSSNSVYDPSLESVQIGDQVWTTRNLNIPVEGNMCYMNETENCEKYGMLYTWSMAMKVDQKYDTKQLGEITLPYQGLCPSGWHIPSDSEWRELRNYLAQHPEYKDYFTNQVGGFYSASEGKYKNEGYETLFWSSTEYDATGTSYPFEYAWLWAFRENKTIDFDNPKKVSAAYIRCIAD